MTLTREYAKIFFDEGTIEQKREILKRLTGRLWLRNKRIYLDTITEESPPEGQRVVDKPNSG